MPSIRLQLPEPRLWTRREYDRVTDMGLFQDERLELIEGVIVRKMPQGSRHAGGIRGVEKALLAAFGTGHDVRVQMPLALDDMSEPEPDVAVVGGAWQDYLKAHPQTALLVVEVADSSLAIDRTTKASLYARAGIQEYWILNLVSCELEVHREPGMDPEQPLGHSYRRVTHLPLDEAVSPLAAPDAIIRVLDVMP